MISSVFNFGESSDMMTLVALGQPTPTAARAFAVHRDGSYMELHESIAQPGLYIIIKYGPEPRVVGVIAESSVDQVHKIFFSTGKPNERCNTNYRNQGTVD